LLQQGNPIDKPLFIAYLYFSMKMLTCKYRNHPLALWLMGILLWVGAGIFSGYTGLSADCRQVTQITLVYAGNRKPAKPAIAYKKNGARPPQNNIFIEPVLYEALPDRTESLVHIKFLQARSIFTSISFAYRFTALQLIPGNAEEASPIA